jgi:hypothetical protein
MVERERITRRVLLGRAAAAGAGTIPLPSAAQVRAEFTRLVGFGRG